MFSLYYFCFHKVKEFFNLLQFSKYSLYSGPSAVISKFLVTEPFLKTHNNSIARA